MGAGLPVADRDYQRVQRPRGMRQPSGQMGCRLTCFVRGGNLQVGTGARRYKALDTKLEGGCLRTLRGHGRS